MTANLTLDDYAVSIPAMTGGNTPWAAGYGMILRDVIHRQANRQPRNLQVQLGPSEIGHECDRRVIGKMAGQPRTNHVTDPWPSIVGTAVHAWLAEKFALENVLNQVYPPRWIPETRVSPTPDHPGTADLYDSIEQSIVDWKVLGPTSLAKVMSAGGPPIHYVVQLLLYAMGYRNLGLPVRRVVLAALPRTAASLDSMYCWERTATPEDDILISQVLSRTALRTQVARLVMAGEIPISSVPRTPSDDCFFCFQFRPQSARDGGPGCPGHSLPR